MLLRFFTNTNATAYLRGLAEEFGESTNAIRHELNNLSNAGYLIPFEDGRTIQYRANTSHPLYNEVRNLVHKYLGIDKLIDHILSRIGDLQHAYIIGDYAQGRDSGQINLVLIGDLNQKYVRRLAKKAEGLLNRKISFEILLDHNEISEKQNFGPALLIWGRSVTNKKHQPA